MSILLGVLVSSVATLIGLSLLYVLVRDTLGDEGAARRTVLYTLLFPSAFVLTCFLSEGVFLCLTVGAFLAASRRIWWAAGVLGGLAALTRPLGILTVIPLAWMAADQIRWDIRRLKPGVAWLALVPAAWIALMAWMYTLTGHLLAPYYSQHAWGWMEEFRWPWQTFLRPAWHMPYLLPIQQSILVLFVVLTVVSFFKWRSKSLGVYMVLNLSPAFLGNGTLPTIRYAIVLFPGFIMLALAGSRRPVHKLLVMVMWTVQVLCFFAWCQFYYVA